MVLMNAGSNARYTSSITNQNQGGGSRKAGFPYQVGRSNWSSIFIIKQPLPFLQKLSLANKNVSQSRPIGSTSNFNIYWHIPGTR
jgi:hypothetical protein